MVSSWKTYHNPYLIRLYGSYVYMHVAVCGPRSSLLALASCHVKLGSEKWFRPRGKQTLAVNVQGSHHTLQGCECDLLFAEYSIV